MTRIYDSDKVFYQYSQLKSFEMLKEKGNNSGMLILLVFISWKTWLN